jgi:hypothetical protein
MTIIYPPDIKGGPRRIETDFDDLILRDIIIVISFGFTLVGYNNITDFKFHTTSLVEEHPFFIRRGDEFQGGVMTYPASVVICTRFTIVSLHRPGFFTDYAKNSGPVCNGSGVTTSHCFNSIPDFECVHTLSP